MVGQFTLNRPPGQPCRGVGDGAFLCGNFCLNHGWLLRPQWQVDTKVQLILTTIFKLLGLCACHITQGAIFHPEPDRFAGHPCRGIHPYPCALIGGHHANRPWIEIQATGLTCFESNQRVAIVNPDTAPGTCDLRPGVIVADRCLIEFIDH